LQSTTIANAPASQASLVASAYTIAVAPASDVATPQGNGYLVGKMSSSGRLRLVGKTGEGKAIAGGGRFRRDGTAIFYSHSGPKQKDSIWSNLSFHTQTDAPNDLDGTMTWVSVRHSIGYYQDGFLSQVPAVGSRFRSAHVGRHVIPFDQSLSSATVNVGNFDDTELLDTSVNVVGKIGVKTEDAAKTLRISFDPKTGLFKGSARLSGDKKSTLDGVVLQKQGVARGIVSLPVRTGSVTIAPTGTP
jgi:hypothetical protein